MASNRKDQIRVVQFFRSEYKVVVAVAKRLERYPQNAQSAYAGISLNSPKPKDSDGVCF